MFLSGQIPLDPATGELVRGGFAAAGGAGARQPRRGVDGGRAATGRAVAKVTVYLTDLARFGEFNEIYAEFFGAHRPARAVIGVAALPRGAEVEVEAVAAR